MEAKGFDFLDLMMNLVMKMMNEYIFWICTKVNVFFFRKYTRRDQCDKQIYFKMTKMEHLFIKGPM
jgi:hypothetical protein